MCLGEAMRLVKNTANSSSRTPVGHAIMTFSTIRVVPARQTPASSCISEHVCSSHQSPLVLAPVLP